MKIPPVNPAGLLSTIECARRLGIHPKTMRNMATGKKPRVRAVKISDKYWLWHWPTVQRDLGIPEEAAVA